MWLLIRKKGSAEPGVGYEDAVEEALCFGWIDSTTNRHDEDHFRLRMSPRKPKSAWAASNKARVDRLIAEGRMTPAGLVKIEAAKADGSWDALDGLEDLTVPDDLAAVLDANPPARAHFDAFPEGTRRQILFWIRGAKRETTRAARVARTAETAARNVRVTEWRPKEGA